MKPRYVIGLVIGAGVGMLLAYSVIGSIGVFNLLIGAFIGALIGLRIASTANWLSGGAFGEKRGTG